MKNIRRLLTLACGITAASVSGAQVIRSIQTLAFGSFVAGSNGTVTVSPNGLRSASGGIILLNSGSGSAASFTVTGPAGASFALELPANGEVTLTSGANTLTATGFTSTPLLSGLRSVGESQTVNVGATLSVNRNQASGSYRGSFITTIIYN